MATLSKLPINSVAQQQRILKALQKSPMTTNEIREELDVMSPSARVSELRKQGHNIITHRDYIDTGYAVHRTARYVLLSKKAA